MYEIVQIDEMWAVRKPNGDLLQRILSDGSTETWKLSEQQAVYVRNLMNRAAAE